MVLLSGAMRAAAFTGDRRPVDAWFAGRQWGMWGSQWAMPPDSRGSGDAQALASLEDLHARGVIDDAELARLRARVGR
jgi:hypothetical protein